MSKSIIVRQHDIKDCGAACLLSIIKFYKGNISLEKIKIDSCISQKGISAYNLIAAAKKYGFDAQGLKVSYEELIKNKVVVPFIAYMEYKNGLKHYIVVYKITKKYILVMDPARTLKKVKHDYFKENYKNVIIELYPITNIISYNKDNKLLDLFLRIFNCNKKIIISILITSFILTITSIVSSFYFKSIIYSIENNLTSLFICISIIFLIINLIKVIISYLRMYYENYLNKNIDTYLFNEFLLHIFSLPLNAIANRSSGEISTRVNELNNIKELFSNMFITLVLNLFMALTSLIVLFYINDKLTYILLIIIIFYLINNIIWLKPINNYVEENIILETNFNSVLINNLNHIISIKNNLKYPLNKLEENLLSYLTHTFSFKNKINIYVFLNSFIMDIGLFILNAIGFIYILNNSLELIDLITYDTLYMYLIDSIKEIINLIPKYVFIKRSFIKINDFLMLEREVIDENETKFINGNILFDKVSFSYNKFDYPINNYTLRIKKNSKVLVMGKSGSGKSTLFKLLFRLYDLDNGNIKIGNINIKDYNLNTIRNNITYVSQDESIINDTLENNILMGRKLDIKTLNNILNICQVNEILDKKSLRLKSYIFEDASNLSGGEKARIFLARALVKNSSIIIFDETFSSIAEDDANTIINNIINTYKNKTIVIISHFKPKCRFDKVIIGGFNNGK